MYIYIYVYMYIYIYIYAYIYIYIYTHKTHNKQTRLRLRSPPERRESAEGGGGARQGQTPRTYRSLGVVSDKIASAKCNPVQTGNTTTTPPTTTTTTITNNKGRWEGESPGTAIERVLEPRSMAPCVARDRWHRAWPAIDGTLRGHCERFCFFLTIYMKKST